MNFLRDYLNLIGFGFFLVYAFPAGIALIGWLLRTQGVEAAIAGFICGFSLIIMVISRIYD
ncbi:MAG: hypothetical protein HC768_24105 [Acaryochloris sp. CRU_2_0]|nr:hypothetical protein [Acaryochloris sp. CRU_2_0]